MGDLMSDLRTSRVEPGAPEPTDLAGARLSDADWLAWARRVQAPAGLGSLGPYELVEEIGRGGQGLVFKARQPGTGRHVAVKRLSAGAFATAEMRARFDREIEAAAALDHPNVVTVFGSELIGDQPALLMQWIDGKPFDEWADHPRHEANLGGRQAPTERREETEPHGHDEEEPPDGDSDVPGRRGVREVLGVFATACDAVHHAHQRGVIHRDLKPSNILIDADDRPHVLDFGLAKLRRAEAASSELTLSGAFIGTPAYASPEQVRGELRDVDIRSDVYSLGAVLYRALIGRTVFDSSAGIARLLDDFHHRVPTAPSTHDRRLDREIDAIALKALAIDKDQRYASVDALRADVLRYLGGEPVLAHPPSAAYRVRKFLRRHAAVSALASLAAAALVTLGVVSTVQAGRERELRGKAERHEQIALDEAKLQRQSADFLLSIIRNIAHAAGGRRSIPVKNLAAWIAGPLETQTMETQPEVRIALHRSISDLLNAARKYESSINHDLKALELAEALGSEGDVTRFHILGYLSNTHGEMGRAAEAEAYAREALELAEATFGRDSLDGSGALIWLARPCSRLGRQDEAEELLLESIDIRDRLNASADARSAPRFVLADLYHEWGKPADAGKLMEDVLASIDSAEGIQNNLEAHCQLRLGLSAFYQGELKRAEQIFSPLVQYRLNALGLRHWRTCEGLTFHGWTLHYLGRYSEAADRFEKALIFYEENANVLGIAQARFWLGTALLAAGREDEGRRQLLRAVSKGMVTEPGQPEWDALVQQAESALRAVTFSLGADLRRQLGDLAWVIAQPIREPGASAETAEPANPPSP